jgi:hypothetical protein
MRLSRRPATSPAVRAVPTIVRRFFRRIGGLVKRAAPILKR